MKSHLINTYTCVWCLLIEFEPKLAIHDSSYSLSLFCSHIAHNYNSSSPRSTVNNLYVQSLKAFELFLIRSYSSSTFTDHFQQKCYRCDASLASCQFTNHQQTATTKLTRSINIFCGSIWNGKHINVFKLYGTK